MPAEDIQLRTVRPGDEAAFRVAADAFQGVKPAWCFAFAYDASGVFGEYIQRLERWSRGLDLPKNFVPNTFLIAAEDDVIVGRVSIRHELNDWLAAFGGHIGYGVVPSRRRRGYATRMLELALPVAAVLGIQRALVTCDVGNVASRRVIEKNGGVFEGITDDPRLDIQKRRYWIDTVHASA
jgi:predicted acetyltransferase